MFDFTTILLSALSIISTVLAVVGWILVYRADKASARMEDYLVDMNDVIATFKMKIDALFDMNIHYYDETIFQFVEDTKKVKEEIDQVLSNYEDLKGYIYPETEKPEQLQEILGVVKPGFGRKLL